MEKTGAVRCQRIGCDAMFTEAENADDSCRYHASPMFHDGMKEWICCKQRSHDFSLFLAIPGCKTGKHTTEKPVLAKAGPANPPRAVPVPPVSQNNNVTAENCSRCRQGFFCSDHGSQGKSSKLPVAANNGESGEKVANNGESGEKAAAPVKKIVNLNQERVCKNKSCGKTYKEKDNHETACEYHPGPAVFHDRLRGWKCCDIHVKEFDEFMEIPPCTKGWHNADA
ncbi:cysteine and histidine-rich domain-containing protein RAR1 [Carex littledalei]|uniref:Cysteine and histidine-rich domain-containing protein RAR1 n=1 Tax=Carex littledalei TaxID=544730 RepID=A0A833QLE0_9POAL|nr:cysteine and histidine-rich domain-containing protein RAR1 [Carex littledalei]